MNIVISGYYGFDNAGDELILESILATLRARYGDCTVTVLSARPSVTAARCNVRAIDRWNWLKVVGALMHCDLLVSGGGGLFQDRTGSLSLYYYLVIILIARLFVKQVFVYAAGVNPMRKINAVITARVLNRCTRITVREEDSARLLHDWGCNGKIIELVADPVLLKGVTVKDITAQSPKIAFILRPASRGRRQAEIFAQLADGLVQRLSARVVFIPFHPGQDLEFSRTAAAMMSAPAEIVDWKSTKELCDALGYADLLISQRLHGLILGALYGIPLLSISDDPKIGRFMKELGQKNITDISTFDHYSLLPLVLDIWEWREEFRKNARLLLPSFKARAARISELLPAENGRA